MSDRRTKDERRSGSERRSLRDRQRAGSDLVTVVEIAGSKLHIAIARRTQSDKPDRIEGETRTWKKEAAILNSEEGLVEFSRELNDLVERRNLQGSSFHFVLGGDLCVTKTVRGTTEEVRNELRLIEERSRLYLSLGTGDKVMVANTRLIDARHQNAVASVCNRGTLNSIHSAALKAGIQIDSIEPALVSVSRVVGRLQDAPTEPCLLMYVDEKSVEVGVCHNGSLLLDYRPGGRTAPSDIGGVVHTHLNRLQRHAGRQLHRSPPELKDVFLCGGKQSLARALRSFATYECFKVHAIDPHSVQATWVLGEEVADSVMVPALGTLLGTYMTKEQRDAPNFMQHIIASTREPIRPVLIRSLITLAAVLLLGVFGLLMNWNLQSEVDLLQQQVDGLQVAKSRYRELRLQLTSAEEKGTELKKLLESMDAAAPKDVIARIGHCMPSDVWLSDLELENMKSVKLSGSSFLEAGVFDFVQWLGQAPEFKDVALRSTNPSNSRAGPTINFNVELDLGDIDDSVEEVASNE